MIINLECPEVSHSALNKFRSQYEAHIRGLKSLDNNVTEAGYLYATILQRKLPRSVLDSIAHSLPSDDIWSLDQLRAGIEQELEHLLLAKDVGDYTRIEKDKDK